MVSKLVSCLGDMRDRGLAEDGNHPAFTAAVAEASAGLGGGEAAEQGPQSKESVREGGSWSLTPTQPHNFLSEILLRFAPAQP